MLQNIVTLTYAYAVHCNLPSHYTTALYITTLNSPELTVSSFVGIVFPIKYTRQSVVVVAVVLNCSNCYISASSFLGSPFMIMLGQIYTFLFTATHSSLTSPFTSIDKHRSTFNPYYLSYISHSVPPSTYSQCVDLCFYIHLTSRAKLEKKGLL